MATSVKIDEAIALGNDLVALLRRQRHLDLLSEWMAHHIADSIIAARHARGRAKARVEQHCVELILRLWQRRAVLPDGHRPFEKFEPILSTLALLDPERERHFYFDAPHRERSDSPPKLGTASHYMDLASKLDHAARILIECLVGEATKAADDPDTRKLLKSGILDSAAPDIEALQRVLAAKDSGVIMDDLRRTASEKRLKDRIQRLGDFLSVARATQRDYQRQLQRLTCGKAASPRKTTSRTPARAIRTARGKGGI